jgi:hypothetical protein
MGLLGKVAKALPSMAKKASSKPMKKGFGAIGMMLETSKKPMVKLRKGGAAMKSSDASGRALGRKTADAKGRAMKKGK